MSGLEFQTIVTSADGSVVVVSLADVGVFTSTDAGATWVRGVFDDGGTLTPVLAQIATNANGSILCLTYYPDVPQTLISRDKGKTWAGTFPFSLVAVAANSNHIFAWDPSEPWFSVSTNNGLSFDSIFENISNFIQEPSNIACNSDGTHVYLSGIHGSSYSLVSIVWSGSEYSIDSVDLPSVSGGPTFSEPGTSIACDSTGQTLVVGDSSGNMWINSNYGDSGTWTSYGIGPENPWRISMASDTIIACSVPDTGITTDSVQIGLRQTDGTWRWQKQLLGNQNWESVEISADGKHAMTLTATGALFQGTRGQFAGWSWSENTYFTLRFGPWDGLCMSATGDLIAACGTNTNIYTSRNFGASWSSNPTSVDPGDSQNWRSIASSADGQRLIACVDGGNLWRSGDYGATWTELVGDDTNGLPGVQPWTSVASDGSGDILLACASGVLLGSSDSGSTWDSLFSDPENSPNFNNVAISRDGRFAIAVSGTNVYVGTPNNQSPLWEFGMRNPSGEPANNWTSSAIDLTGQHMAVCADNGKLFTSVNEGLDWTDASVELGGFQSWTSIDMDDTGQHLVACANPGDIYTSSDYGVLWIARGVGVGNHPWDTVASSADGSVIAAIDREGQSSRGGQIYISRDYGATWTSADYSSPPVGIPTLPPAQITANIRGKEGAASRLTDFSVGTALVRNRPQRFTGFDDYGLFAQANALANTVNRF